MNARLHSPPRVAVAPRQRGFTLIELMVAIAILAVISVIGLTGLSRIIDSAEIAREHADRWQEIQLALRIVTQDLAQTHPRVTRDELGDATKGSFIANALETYDLEFSRGGWANPVGLTRGTVLRVAYNLEEDELVRYYWPVMDRTLATMPFRTVLLSGVELLEMTFIDANGESHFDWPPTNTAVGSADPTARPRAARISVTLEDFGTVWRIVEISG